ncbi:MAG: orotidine-5'-phosphate decarboxylase [Gemmatimonadetes bacterium]|nr:orotidine-5'-phosphate decarboxylase [Gemmatimonadota bacterium]
MAEVIVAFDMPSPDDARRMVERIPGLKWVKVGPILYLNGGPQLVREFKNRGARVFLDFKWHDIPNTVSGAVRAAADLGVDLATVHTLGGAEMMAAAAKAASGCDLRLVGVSVLTSHTSQGYFDSVGRPESSDLTGEVVRLARAAVAAGLGGLVASPLEIQAVRPVLGAGRWIVVPGIRRAGSDPGDQHRTADPASAARAGATHLVVGRPVTQAADPAAVYQEICASAA